MPKFKAIRNSFGYLGTYWKKGDVVEADACPNHHFAPLDQALKMEEEAEAAKKKAEMNELETVEKAVKARGRAKK